MSVFFRVDQDTQDEYEVCRAVLSTTRYLVEVPEDEVIIGRYSVLPFYKHLEEELGLRNSRLINSWSQHDFIASMHWASSLQDMTPKTFQNEGYATVPDATYGWVVKGATNSRKWKWKTHMRARDRQELRAVCERLYDDPLISEQGLVIREYVPLLKLEDAINDLPVTHEWRFFFLGKKRLAQGYYWSMADGAEEYNANCPKGAIERAQDAANIISDMATFFVVDVAETETGEWIVIEINDGQMSGLSMTDPEELYTNLKESLR